MGFTGVKFHPQQSGVMGPYSYKWGEIYHIDIASQMDGDWD